MRRGRLILLGLAAYVIGLVAIAPASLIDAELERASAGALRLTEASGTLWSGAGRIEIRDTNRRSGIGKSIAWRVRPAYLLLGKLVFEVEVDRAGKGFPVTVSPSQVEVADANVSLPAAVFGLGAPRLAPLGLTGELQVHVARLALGRRGVRGNASLRWRSAGSAFVPVSPLGDYELRLEGDGSTAHALLRTLQGPLQLEGEGSWTHGGKPVLRATARVPPQYRQQLVPLLRLIAVERSDGSFTLQ